MKTPLSILYVLFVALACTPSGIVHQLDLAKDLLQDAPDSSLRILSLVNSDEIRSQKERARYALLLSAALDKNYIDIASDSLIHPAVEYFGKSHDLAHRMMTYYYLARVYQNNSDNPAAMIALEKAETDALTLCDDFYLGLIYRSKSAIYNSYYNIETAIRYKQMAISAFKRADKSAHAAYATLSLAINYTNGRYYKKAMDLLDSLQTVTSDANLLYQMQLLKAEINIENNGDLNETLCIYKETPDNYFSYLDKGLWAVAAQRSSDEQTADIQIQESYAMAHSETDSATIGFMHSRIAADRGDYAKAFSLVNKAALVQDSLTKVRLDQSLDGVLREYYKQETTLEQQKNRQMKERLWMISLIGILALFLLFVIFNLQSRKKDAQMKEYMAQLSAGKEELSKAVKQNASLIGSLFSERLYHLDELSEAYYANDNAATKEALFKEFKAKVFALRDDEHLFNSLEEDLNKNCNGLMEKFRKQVHSIKGDNLKTTMLFFAGFPYRTIQVALRKNSIDSLRTAKSRIRKAINDSHAPDASLFLKLLESN